MKMGEMAEMMINGDLCENCGSYIDEEGGDGFPRYCSESCANDRGVDDNAFNKEHEEALTAIESALREYKKIAYKFKCEKNKCKKTSKGVLHQKGCHADKHKKSAKKAWTKFQAYFI